MSFTYRGNIIRIISARKATKNERKIYEKKIKYINGDKVTIYNNPNEDMEDDIPDEIDFSNAEPFRNTELAKRMGRPNLNYILEPDIVKYFNNLTELNHFLRSQINSLKMLNHA